MHLGLLLDDIASLPNIYHKELCVFMATLKTYADMLILIVSCCMTIAVHKFLHSTDIYLSRYVLSNKNHMVIFGIPMLAILPMTDNVYGPIAGAWCGFQYNLLHAKWWFVSYMIICSSILLYNLHIFFVILSKTRRSDWDILEKIFTGIGLYSVVAIICWAPKYFSIYLCFHYKEEEVRDIFYFSRMSMYLSGVIYTLMYLCEKKSLRLFESYVQTDPGIIKSLFVLVTFLTCVLMVDDKLLIDY
jgi:hypothetical protein